ncbi:MAG: beta-ketoacyl-ACP synthase II [Paludibacteraceae bacterium]|nr:beta-ketoacyl-ACP synthase II [Paludibacteraceae bacterium]
MKRVVITGLGLVTALGNDVPTCWANLIAGKSGAGIITHFDSSKFKTQFACEVKDLDVSNLFDPKELRRYDRYIHLTVKSAEEAINNAGLHITQENPLRCGVIYGSGMGGVKTLDTNIGEFGAGDGIPRYSPFFIPMIITNMAAGMLAIRYGFKGVNYATTSACSSSSHAIANACYQIRMGLADVVLTGGSEAAIECCGIGGFNALHALSTRNDSPQTACRPFSASRDGFVLGEGAGTLVLEEYEHAKARGAHIYAELVGIGLTADAYHLTASDPEGIGAKNAMQLAINEAGILPSQVDYINAHGTSTPIGDIAEVKAIQDLFGKDAYNISITSSKSMTGHLLGGTGAVEAIISILSMQYGMVTPTINHEEGDKDPNIDYKLDFTFNHAKARTIQYAMSNNFGFGGHNACLLFKNPNIQ